MTKSQSGSCATLTKREWQVLNLVAHGLSSKEIGLRLKIESRTVERHIDHIRARTRTKNRPHMVAVAASQAGYQNGTKAEATAAASGEEEMKYRFSTGGFTRDDRNKRNQAVAFWRN